MALGFCPHERLPCTHKGTYADDCIVERVAQHKCDTVATCDRDLTRRISKVPGVPIMYITQHKYSIERLPEATKGGGMQTGTKRQYWNSTYEEFSTQENHWFTVCSMESSQVLITSADSRIRIFDGSQMMYEFRASGFRNTSSHIAASFSSDGKYVISASEDSHVYIWKRQPKSSRGKSKTSISV
ncbi:uncharacterized protein LOC129870601 [Solanum dulcamara]|uniref:uncharacterized protein LOC129870601 n=1 Tax=Solanum dulcamara TaxID=45834 RepID=UPI002485DCE1|nr:uncharacterized protein LOC129870601 [Solanum dulcamara]